MVVRGLQCQVNTYHDPLYFLYTYALLILVYSVYLALNSLLVLPWVPYFYWENLLPFSSIKEIVTLKYLENIYNKINAKNLWLDDTCWYLLQNNFGQGKRWGSRWNCFGPGKFWVCSGSLCCSLYFCIFW